ncbi:MAG: superoxide dismutase [bacterium]
MPSKLNSRDHLKPKGLEGISDKQLDFHFDTHYKGYVTKYNEIQERLGKADLAGANQNYSEFRSLKVEESFNYMGIILHELYFENLGKKGEPSSSFKEMVWKKFGSEENLWAIFKATGIALRGWAVLSLDIFTGHLMVNGLDAHNLYGFIGSIPIIVLDVYEHAYYVDQGPKRAPYIDNFFKNLNWEVINRRLEKALASYQTLKDFIK